MGRKLPLLFLFLWSPLALGSVLLIVMSIGIHMPWTDLLGVRGLMWSGAYGFGGVIGYVSGWRFVARLSPQCNLSADEDYGSIAWGLSIGMLTCLVMFLHLCFQAAHEDALLSGFFPIAMVTLIPFFTGCWALNKIATARRKSVSE